MKHDASEILKEALKLPLEARAAITGSLLDSLDETIDEDVESAWENEILLRLKKIDDDKVKLVPWAKARTPNYRKMTGTQLVQFNPDAIAIVQSINTSLDLIIPLLPQNPQFRLFM